MKKLLSVILITILLFTLSACTNNSKSPKEITNYLTEELDIEGLTTVKGETLSHYFGFTIESLESFSFVVSADDNKADMIAAFEVKNDETQKQVIDGIGNYLSGKASILKTNMTTEYNKISNRVVYKYNNIIVLVVCGDSNTAIKALEEIGATELK